MTYIYTCTVYAQKSHTPHTGDIPMIVQCTMYTVQCIYVQRFLQGQSGKVSMPYYTQHIS